MSIFSRISRSRQQAKDHNAKLAEQQKKEQQKPPYRHVPTHAASDAIASAPPSWREADRIRIQEENRRRSAMAASGHHMNMPGVPRVGSSLSHVSFPADANANPMVVRVPRAHSYSGLPSSYLSGSYLGGSYLGGRDVVYSPDVTMHYAASTRAKEGGAPAYRKAESGSSSGTSSSSSQDDLEIRPVHAPVEPRRRMHASRRISDSSIDRIAMANSARVSRDSRPPTSMKPMGGMGYAQNSFRSPSPGGYAHPAVSQDRSSDLSYLVAASSMRKQEEEEEEEYDGAEADGQEEGSRSSQGRYSAEPVAVAAPADVKPSKGKDGKRPTSTTRFTEVELVDGARGTSWTRTRTHSSAADAPAPIRILPATAPTNDRFIVNVFPEEAFVPEPETKKSRRFSKSGGKLRKGRWAGS